MGSVLTADQIIIRKKIIRDIVEDLEFHIDGIEPEEQYKWRDDNTLLLYLARNSDNSKAFMKIPCGEAAERQVDATYKVHKLISDKKNIEPILEEKPRIYQANNKSYKAILMDRAKYSLKDHFTQLSNLSQKKCEDELFNIIIESSLGLKKAHDKGIIHKDVKESNIMLYSLGWGIGDFGFSSISNAIDNRDVSSVTARQRDEYMDYELLHSVSKVSKHHIFNYSTDIFALGVVLYKGTGKDHLSPFSRFSPTKSKEMFSPEWVLQDIDKSERSDKMKYFLKRMLGARMPEGISGAERLKYRYASVDELLADARDWPNIKSFNGKNRDYEPFLKENDAFIKLLNKEKNNRDGKGLINNESIDTIVTAYEALQNMYNSTDAKKSLDAQKKFLSICDEYNGVRYDQEILIKRLIAKIPEDTKGLEEMLSYTEKAFLFGPPFTNAKRASSNEKARYKYNETVTRQTHYHKELDLIISKYKI